MEHVKSPKAVRSISANVPHYLAGYKAQVLDQWTAQLELNNGK